MNKPHSSGDLPHPPQSSRSKANCGEFSITSSETMRNISFASSSSTGKTLQGTATPFSSSSSSFETSCSGSLKSADFKEPEQDVSNDEDEEENGVAVPWSVLPVDDDEAKLMFLIVSEDVIENSPQFAFDLEDCGGCGKSPDECGLFIDGRLHGQTGWSHLCAKCFVRMGEGVGW